jgi:hypothetical protein
MSRGRVGTQVAMSLYTFVVGLAAIATPALWPWTFFVFSDRVENMPNEMLADCADYGASAGLGDAD